METLPLFPLHTVLFPGMPLPLHIFEERYKAMVRHCQAEKLPFGAVLIASGSEVGAPAVPRQVGTTARISQVEPLEEGRLNLVAVGERRFRLIEVLEARPYLVGRVEWFPAESEPPPSRLVATVRAELGRYLDRLFELLDQSRIKVELPEEPEPLSYLTAAVLQVGLEPKQALLEAPTTALRLEAEVALLAGQVEVQEVLRLLKPTLGPVTPIDPALSRLRVSPN